MEELQEEKLVGKNILAIVSSPRKGGNSEMLVDRFIEGAQEAGHFPQKICLRDKKIAPCTACEACLGNGGVCVQKDDMEEILQKMIEADVILLSTPVYFYSISAQLKIMIDRTLAGHGKIEKKEFYLIATAAAKKDIMECTMNDMQGFVENVPGSVVKGRIYGSAFKAGEIKGKPAMEEAYEYGKNC